MITESTREIGSSIAVVKRGVNAVMFGISAWKRISGISDERRFLKIEKLEREIKEARTLIANKMRRERPELNGLKSTTILSRAVEEEDVDIMKTLERVLAGGGWKNNNAHP